MDDIADVQHHRRAALLPGLERCDVLQGQLQAAFDTALHQRNSLANRVTELADKVAAQRATQQGASAEFLHKAQAMGDDLRSRLADFDAQLDGAEADLKMVDAKAQKFIHALQQASKDESQLLEELSAMQHKLKRFVQAVNEAGYEVEMPPLPVATAPPAQQPAAAAAAQSPVATSSQSGHATDLPPPSHAAAGQDEKPAPRRRRVQFAHLNPPDDAVPSAFAGATATGKKDTVPLPAAPAEDLDSMGNPAELKLKLQRLLDRMADLQRDLATEQECMKRAVEEDAAVRKYKQQLESAA